MAWTTPVTWANGAVTAASFNEQIRDNETYLKAALDLITNSTTADSGTATYISVTRADIGSDVTHFRALMSGDTQPRWMVYFDDSDGLVRMAWGAGGASAVDTFLQRASAAVLQLTGGTSLDNIQTATNTSFFRGYVTTDANPRIRMFVQTAGGGSLDVGDGTTASLGRFYYDVTNTRTALTSTAASGLYISGGAGLSLISTAEVLVSSGGATYIEVNASDAVVLWDGTASHAVTVTPAALPQIELGNDSSTVISRTAQGRLAASGRLAAGDGLATAPVASSVTDGDFSYTAESGLMAVDTSNGFLAVREGTTWRGSDLRGDMCALGPYVATNIATSETASMGIGYIATWVPFDDAAVYNDSPTGVGRMPAPFAGSVIALSVRSSEARTAGTVEFEGMINGTPTGLGCTLSGTVGETTYKRSRQAPGIDTFVADDTLGIQYTTASWTPTTAQFTAFLYVLYTRGDIYS